MGMIHESITARIVCGLGWRGGRNWVSERSAREEIREKRLG